MSLDKSSFPNDWKVVPVSDVVFFQEGPGVRRFQYTDSGVKLLNGGNINKGILNLSSTERYISDDEAYGKYKHFLVEEGDLLIACSGVVVEKFDGKIAYAKKEHLPLCMNTSTMRFRSLDRDILHLDYFRWFLTTTYFKRQLQQLITGSAQLNFGPSHIKLMSIPLPPLETQKQIAAVLEKADQLRKDCQQMEQELNSLAQSVFIDMFGDPVTNPKGWDKKLLSELVDNKDDIKCGPFGTQLGKSEFTTHGVPLWGIRHVNSGFKKPTVEFVSPDKAVALKTYSIESGDIVMTRKGNVGNCFIYPEAMENGVMHSDLLRIRPCEKKVNSNFLQKQFMYSQDVEGQLRLISQGAIMAGINVTKLKSLVMLCPPLVEQKKYAQVLQIIDDQKELLTKKGDEVGDAFNSLVQKAFKGELKLKPLKTKAA